MTQHLPAHRSRLSPATFLWLMALATAAVVAALPSAERMVALPGIVVLDVTAVVAAVIWRRHGALPVFDLGMICIGTTAVYAVVPLVNFISQGLAWTVWSDNRLLVHNPGPPEVAAFAWQYVIYTTALAAAYLFFRLRAAEVTPAPVELTGAATTTTLVLLFAGLGGYFWFLYLWYGVSYSLSYADLRAGIGLPTDLPYAMQQVSHNLHGMVLITKQALVMVAMKRWNRLPWRIGLIVWLAFEVLATVLRMGARIDTVLLLLTTALLYHRLVRPLRLRVLAPATVAFLAALIVYGLVRDTHEGSEQLVARTVPLAAVNNEFQSLFATGYDLQQRVANGSVGHVPWQLYVSDLTLPIPSQVLPFQKIEPSNWYMEILGIGGAHEGFMFGVISQSAIGLGWIELVLRGLLLGMVIAFVHRWYTRNAANPWVTLLYLFLCSWAFYTFRSTTFHIAYMVIYRFVPMLLLVRLGERVLGAMLGPRPVSISPEVAAVVAEDASHDTLSRVDLVSRALKRRAMHEDVASILEEIDKGAASLAAGEQPGMARALDSMLGLSEEPAPRSGGTVATAIGSLDDVVPQVADPRPFSPDCLNDRRARERSRTRYAADVDLSALDVPAARPCVKTDDLVDLDIAGAGATARRNDDALTIAVNAYRQPVRPEKDDFGFGNAAFAPCAWRTGKA